MRAIHQSADDEPRILADSVAPLLVDSTAQTDEWIRGFVSQPFSKALRSGFLLRNRYAEDSLAEAVKRGVRQYLILGAGLDTFAFRQPSWATELCIYEVDLPTSQGWKRERLAAAGLSIPSNLVFVAIDFERTSLSDALRSAGFDLGGRTFCSWLGVTQYLTSAAIDATLQFVLSLPHGSEIVFSFIIPWQSAPPEDAQSLIMSARKAAEVGEPWLSTSTPEELKTHLHALGFSEVVHLTPEEAQERYFKGRRDGLAAPHSQQIMRAVV